MLGRDEKIPPSKLTLAQYGILAFALAIRLFVLSRGPYLVFTDETFQSLEYGHYFVYGSGVSLVAAGSGSVRLAGLPETPHGDGQYSLNNEDFTSLPGIQTAKLLIGDG